MTISTKYFPFVSGLGQKVEDRLLEPGRPRAIENLFIEKLGRLRMRYDYSALASTVQQGAGNYTLQDLVSVNDRLLGIGQFDNSGTAMTAAPVDLFTFIGAPLFGWRETNELTTPRLPLASHLRDVGMLAESGTTSAVTDMDVAAGNGLVALVYTDPFFSGVLVHIVSADTGATIIYQHLSGLTLPRVVCVGSGSAAKFFIGGVNGTTPKLFRYDPVADSSVTALADPAGAGGAINSFDMSLAHEGTTFWMAYGRAGPVTRIHGFNSSGTETHDFAGPAVLCFFITIFTEASIGGVVRIHLACVINATNAVNMSTYLGATSTLETNSPALFAGATQQVGLSLLDTTANVLVAFQQTANIFINNYVNSSHALGTSRRYDNATMSSKLLTVLRRPVFACRVREASDGSSTHLLIHVVRTAGVLEMNPAAILDRLLASAGNGGELPNLSLDATTQRTYWVRAVIGGLLTIRPSVMELYIARQARIQTTQLGSTLYLSGGIVTAYDNRAITEVNFLTRPVITSAGNSAGGSLTALGVYQMVLVYEATDADGNRIQSPPSDVFTQTLGVGENKISIFGIGPHTLRMPRFTGGTQDDPQPIPYVVLYRTKDTNGGNITFYRDNTISFNDSYAGNPGATVTMVATISDAALELNEVLYTQGARGSLSGPLPFVPPEACGSIAASADRILSGQLPEQARIQESRGLFPAEQCNWSDAIGFIRDTRGRVLAVARLDERRIIFTNFELLEMDGPGLDDNGNGDLGAPRKLPSDVGVYGGDLGWRSIVECALGLMFQGASDQIYLLPRGGTTPQRIGLAVQTKLAAFPTITAAIYNPSDRTVRFTCNNLAGSDSIALIYDMTHDEWVTEGPYGVPTAAAAVYQSRMVLLQNNVIKQQLASHPPAALIANAWRSGTIHPFGLGQFGRVLNYQFYGEYRGDCLLTCTATYEDSTAEVLTQAEVNSLTLGPTTNVSGNQFPGVSVVQSLSVGNPYSFKFTPNQLKCECVRVDWDVGIPFPNPVGLLSNSILSAANALSVSLSTNRINGDRVIVIIMQADSGNAPTAAGWTQLFTNFVNTLIRVTVLERTMDGTEVSPVSFSWTGAASAAFSISYTFRNVAPGSPSEVAGTFTGVSSTTSNVIALTPSWGTENTRWISVLALATRTNPATNISIVPASFGRFISVSNSVATENLNGQLASGDRALRASSLIPSAWTWSEPSAYFALTIGVRQNAAIASEGLAYHYWTMDVEDAGKSALKSPLQMG